MVIKIKEMICILAERIIPLRLFDMLWHKYYLWIAKQNKSESLMNQYYIKNSSNKAKKYYLIRRSSESASGIFAIANIMLFGYDWAVGNGYIPLLDIECKDVFQKEEFGKCNRWEYIFRQKEDVASAMKRGNVLVDRIDGMQFSRKTCKSVNGNPEDVYVHATDIYKKEYYKKLNQMSQNVWTFNAEMEKKFEQTTSKMFKPGMRVLGVVLREEFGMPKEKMSEEQKQVYSNHPRALSLEDTYKLVEKYMLKWNCTHVLFTTMFLDSVEFFTDRLGEKALFVERERERYADFVVRNDKVFKNYINNKGNGYKDILDDSGYDEVKIKKQMQEYVLEVVSIANCTCCMGVKCSGMISACIINGGEYEELYFFEDENKISRY